MGEEGGAAADALVLLHAQSGMHGAESAAGNGEGRGVVNHGDKMADGERGGAGGDGRDPPDGAPPADGKDAGDAAAAEGVTTKDAVIAVFLLPRSKGPVHGVLDCVRELSELSLTSAKRRKWLPQLAKATSIDSFGAANVCAYEYVCARQTTVGFLTCESDLAKSIKIVEEARRRPGAHGLGPCARVVWRKKGVDVVLTRDTLLAMRRIHSAKKKLKQVDVGQSWLAGFKKLPDCRSRGGGSSPLACSCMRCGGGVDAAPFSGMSEVMKVVDYVSKTLPAYPLGETFFKYSGNSRHAHRYTGITLSQADLVAVVSSTAWLNISSSGRPCCFSRKRPNTSGCCSLSSQWRIAPRSWGRTRRRSRPSMLWATSACWLVTCRRPRGCSSSSTSPMSTGSRPRLTWRPRSLLSLTQ